MWNSPLVMERCCPASYPWAEAKKQLLIPTPPVWDSPLLMKRCCPASYPWAETKKQLLIPSLPVWDSPLLMKRSCPASYPWAEAKKQLLIPSLTVWDSPLLMKSSQRATNRKRDKRILLFIYTVKNVFILRYTGIKSMYLYIYCTLLEKLFLYYTVPTTNLVSQWKQRLSRLE